MKKLAILLFVLAIIFGCSNPNRKNNAADIAAQSVGFAAEVALMVLLGVDTDLSGAGDLLKESGKMAASHMVGSIVDETAYQTFTADDMQTGINSSESLELPVHYNASNIDSCNILDRKDDVDVYGGNYIVRWHDCDENGEVDYKSYSKQDINNLKVLYVENIQPLKKPQADSQEQLAEASSR